jgi:hypothetical protein
MRVQGEHPRARRRAIGLAIVAAGVLAVGQGGLWLCLEPIATWSYDLSWWSAILLCDALVFLRIGSSILLSRPRGFFGLAIGSGAYWLLYECANLRLENWYYVGIPPDAFTRSVGVFLSFATVIPGVLEIHALISSFSARADGTRPGRAIAVGTRAILFSAGAMCLALPLLYPRWAYPLIWGAAFLLLEPWLAPRDELSLLARLSAGDRGPLLRMLVAGCATGAMWETWNWRSPAKWIYTVPLFDEGKLFEMPYLGFVGFVPFALGCHSFARALVATRCIPEWDPSARAMLPVGSSTEPARAPARAWTAGLAALAFSAIAIAAVDRLTVHATRPVLADIPGMRQDVERRLQAAGIRRPEDLLDAESHGFSGIDLTDVGTAERRGWVDAARLMTVRGMGRRGLEWLEGAGVATVSALAVRDPLELHRAILEARAGPAPVPTQAEVRIWIFGARAIRPPEQRGSG